MTTRFRLLDATANRAAEALRVMEDLARFTLDHAPLAAELKAIRHDLRHAIDTVADPAQRLAWRNVAGDVGATMTTNAEHVRRSLRDVADAAAARAAQALRSLEEIAKILPTSPSPQPTPSPAALASPSHALERLRYRLYAAHQTLALALGTGRAPQWSLCVLLTESLCQGRPWLDVARAAIDGGADCLQLREKSLADADLLDRARRLVDLARAAPSRPAVVINDRPDIALLAGADAVHLGQQDLSPRDAHRIVGDTLLIGVSTATIEQARAAAHSGADYCGLGPMFPTTTKHKPVLAGPEYLRAYLADPVASQRPHLAISGITPGNVGQLIDLGCRGVAVSSAVCAAPDPAAVCRALRSQIDRAPASPRAPDPLR